MSGASRELSSTDGSIFFAVAKACALSRTPDSALRPIVRAGIVAWDIENDMGFSLGLLEVGGAEDGKRARSFQPARGTIQARRLLSRHRTRNQPSRLRP